MVFAINPDGTGYTNFYTFTGGDEGGTQPNGGLLLVGNTFYGTTANGDTGSGSIFATTSEQMYYYLSQ